NVAPVAILSVFTPMKTRIYAAFILCFWVTACAGQYKEIFSPLEQWKAAIIRGDVKALKGFYSQQPIARISVITKGSSEISPDSDVSFWIGLKARRMELK